MCGPKTGEVEAVSSVRDTQPLCCTGSSRENPFLYSKQVYPGESRSTKPTVYFSTERVLDYVTSPELFVLTCLFALTFRTITNVCFCHFKCLLIVLSAVICPLEFVRSSWHGVFYYERPSLLPPTDISWTVKRMMKGTSESMKSLVSYGPRSL